jgi:hypothetical protein
VLVALQLLFAGPVMTPGMLGTDEIAFVRNALVPHPLFAVTESVPEVNNAEKSTVTALVPCPLEMDAWAGAVQL